MKNGECNYGYVEHMLAEHRRLDQLIRRTLAAVPSWEELDTAEWLPRMKRGLSAIQAELSHHFRDEEQGGCLEEAVERCPHLSQEVQKIEAQHDEILARLSELADRCQCNARLTPQQARSLEQELRQIVRELRTHEALENKVMQEGFGVCLQSEEAAAPIEEGALPQPVLPKVRPASV